jgi:hypothetical protein
MATNGRNTATRNISSPARTHQSRALCPLPYGAGSLQPTASYPAPSALCLLANRDAFLPPSVLQNSEQCAIRGFTMLCRCLRLHSCEPCLDRPAQPNPAPLSRRLDDSASGSDQNMHSLKSHCGVECGPAPNLPNCSRGLARLMLPTITMACIPVLFSICAILANSPVHCCSPQARIICLLDVLCWLGALCSDMTMLSSNSSASHSKTQTITGHRYSA